MINVVRCGPVNGVILSHVRRGFEMRSIPAIAVVTLFATTGAFGQSQERSLDELIATVKGDDSIKSASAVRAIGKLKSTSDLAIQTLVDALSDDRRADHIPDNVPILFRVATVGDDASDALAEIGEPAVLPICDLLRQGPHLSVSRRAILALKKMEGAAAEALPLLEQLLTDPEESIRYHALSAMIEIQKDAAALSSTLGTVLSDDSPDVRVAAIRALADLGEMGAQNVASLVALLDDPSEYRHWFAPDFSDLFHVRSDAAMALAEMGEQGRVALPKLREMMHEDADWRVRIAAAFAIAKLDKGQQDGLDYLIETARDTRDEYGLPAEAIETLGKLGPQAEAALPALVDALQHPEPWVRARSVEAIASVAPDSAEERLLSMARDKDSGVRQAAFRGLGTIGASSPEALETLKTAAVDEDFWVRRDAVVALGQLGDKATSALPLLTRLADEDEEEWVKNAAVEAIRQIKQGQ